MPRRKAAESIRYRARAASVGAVASPTSPKPVSSSSPARASSLHTTAEAGAKTPSPRASVGSSRAVALEAVEDLAVLPVRDEVRR